SSVFVPGPVTIHSEVPSFGSPVAIDSHGPPGPLRDKKRSMDDTPSIPPTAVQEILAGMPTISCSPPLGAPRCAVGPSRILVVLDPPPTPPHETTWFSTRPGLMGSTRFPSMNQRSVSPA